MGSTSFRGRYIPGHSDDELPSNLPNSARSPRRLVACSGGASCEGIGFGASKMMAFWRSRLKYIKPHFLKKKETLVSMI